MAENNTKHIVKKTKSAKSEHDINEENITALLMAEFLFILLPFIVLAIVTSYKTSIYDLLFVPEWSLSAAILFGVTIVKFVAGSTVYTGKLHWQRVILAVAIILVLGLAPSLIILALVLISNELSTSLTVAQLVFFSLAVLVYFTIGSIGHSMLEKVNK